MTPQTGFTPLHCAVMCGNANTAELLLSVGGNPLEMDATGNSAIDLAVLLPANARYGCLGICFFSGLCENSIQGSPMLSWLWSFSWHVTYRAKGLVSLLVSHAREQEDEVESIQRKWGGGDHNLEYLLECIVFVPLYLTTQPLGAFAQAFGDGSKRVVVVAFGSAGRRWCWIRRLHPSSRPQQTASCGGGGVMGLFFCSDMFGTVSQF